MISVVIPVFNNESSLQIVVDEIVTALKLYSNNSEIILVDDASHDNSLSLAKSLQKTYPAVKCIALPQNKGQHYAIYKGLKKAKGDWVIVMDADGQDNPSLIPTLVAETQNSLDAILIARQNRKSSVLDLLTNAIFYWLWQMLGNKKANANVSNFGIYKRSIVDAILATKFPPFSLQLIAIKLNAPIKYISGNHSASEKSNYSFASRWALAKKIFYLYSYKSLKRFLFAGIFSILLANSLLVRYLKNSSLISSGPFLDAVLITVFMLLGAISLFLFFSIYSQKKQQLIINE